MAILAVFHNFFRYYQNDKNIALFAKFFCAIFCCICNGIFGLPYTLYIKNPCPPNKDKKTKSVYLSAVEIRLISHFKAPLTHCRNSRIILRPPLETFLGPLKCEIDGIPILPNFQKLGNFGLFCANCTINCIIVVIQSS